MKERIGKSAQFTGGANLWRDRLREGRRFLICAVQAGVRKGQPLILRLRACIEEAELGRSAQIYEGGPISWRDRLREGRRFLIWLCRQELERGNPLTCACGLYEEADWAGVPFYDWRSNLMMAGDYTRLDTIALVQFDRCYLVGSCYDFKRQYPLCSKRNT